MTGRIFAGSLVITGLIGLLLSSSGCASTRAGNAMGGEEPSPPAQDAVQQGRETAVLARNICVFVDYNEKMYANLQSINDLAVLLQQQLVERLDQAGYHAEAAVRGRDSRRTDDQYQLRVRIDDYHAGPRKTVFVKYELDGDGIPRLESQLQLSTMKGASKLARVVARQLAVVVDQRIRAQAPSR